MIVIVIVHVSELLTLPVFCVSLFKDIAKGPRDAVSFGNLGR